MLGPHWRLTIAAIWLGLLTGAAFAERAAPVATVVFAVGVNRISSTDNKILEELSIKAKADPSNWINLEAYTNDLGSRELNLALAHRRLEDVRSRLVMLGFPSHRIRGMSYRKKGTIKGDLPMRRVEIRIEKLGQ